MRKLAILHGCPCIAPRWKPEPLFPPSGTADLNRAMGMGGAGDPRKLNRMLQLTGFSDPVYAEAYITVHQYDIVMDITVGRGWQGKGGVGGGSC